MVLLFYFNFNMILTIVLFIFSLVHINGESQAISARPRGRAVSERLLCYAPRGETVIAAYPRG